MGDAAEQVHFLEIVDERTGVARQPTEQLKAPTRPPDPPPGLEEILDPLALGDSAGEEKRAGFVVPLRRVRAKLG